VRTIDYEDDHGEGVSEDELEYPSDVHGDSAEEVVGSWDWGEGCGGGALELEEGEDCAGERDEEAEDAEEGGVSWLRLAMRGLKGNMDYMDGSYLVFWRDLLLLLRVGRRDARIDPRWVTLLLDGRGRCVGDWVCPWWRSQKEKTWLFGRIEYLLFKLVVD
jgi:hypothetical protein